MTRATIMAGQSAFFLTGNVFTLIVGFTLQIYLAKHLGADGLGVFGLLESGSGMMTALLSFGIAATTIRYIPEHLQKKEYALVHFLVCKGGAALLGLGIIGFMAILILTPLIKNEWPMLAHLQSEIIFASLLIPLGMLLFFSSQVLRGFLDIRYIVIGSSFIQLTVKTIFTVLFLSFGWSLLGYIWAVIVATIVALVWMLIGIRKHLNRISGSKKKSVSIQPEWKSYARVMYGNSLLSALSAPLDRFLLGYYLSSGAVGVLMVAQTLYALPAIFLLVFLSIVAPMMAAAYSKGNQDEVEHIYHLCTDWLVRISLPLLIFLMVFADPVLKLYGEQFATQGTTLLQLFLFAQLFSLLCGPIGNVLNMCGLEKKMFKISIVSVVISSLIMIIVIPKWGLIGAGVAVVFAVIFPNFAALYVAKKHLSLQWWHSKYRTWLWPLAITVTAALLTRNIVSGPFELVVVLIFLYIIFHGTQWFLHGLNDDDMEIYIVIRKKLGLS